QLLWQTGKSFEHEARELVNSTGTKGFTAAAFVDRMDLAYTAADVVISRAGAMAIAELSAAGKACILVPSPNVTEDHQTKNAQAMVDQGAAIMVKDAEAGERLISTLLQLMNDETGRSRLMKNIHGLARPDAALDIARLAVELIESRKHNKTSPHRREGTIINLA
ncbi:MAG: UDP-N-acetylglucosamine--N-acetylmuramyl-(pentapeptide) pyrophosphoryl-undecaprenol N-acetylglucosamine transferase, partial [Bacteroidales bacterium]|nr:UDP-N-acetylglucosamine--N-acetylmuramyl-(pentapeptide) pyrophosphoryl-undecaprenol N-acetylglucosamine transferase [Bacteroidales bacterium]